MGHVGICETVRYQGFFSIPMFLFKCTRTYVRTLYNKPLFFSMAFSAPSERIDWIEMK